MARMKTLGIYALIVIVFFIYSNFLINLGMKSVYKQIEKGTIFDKQIEITKAQATYVNGYVEGKITNNTQSKIEKKYIKIDIYSKRDVLLTTKYIKIENLEPNKTQDFKIGFKATDSYRFEARLVDEAQEKDIQQIQLETEDFTRGWVLKLLLVAMLFG